MNLMGDATIQDITFLKKAAAQGPGIVIVVRDSDLKIIFGNNLFEHYLGYSPDDVSSGTIFFGSLLEENQLNRLRLQLSAANQSESRKIVHSIFKLQNKTGSVNPYYLFASPVVKENEENDLLFNLLLVPDNSRWKLPFFSHDTRELFLEHFQTEDFGTFEWLVDEDRSYWSPGIYKIFEVDEQYADINRAFVRDFIHPNDKDRVRIATHEAIDRGLLLTLEFDIITAKNNVKTVNSLGRVVWDKEGKPTKFVGSIRDITTTRNIEGDLKKKVDELYLSNKELEEFAYVASHDMQEPLRKITTFSSRLMEKYKDALTGDGAMYLNRMMASAENMRVLINDLLEFSRISNTQQPFTRIDLNVILRQVKTDLELIIEETGTQISSDILPEIEAIPSQMKQLFTNIISNAIKFRKQGVVPTITIKSSIVEKEAGLLKGLNKNEEYYQIKIMDNGIGFEDEYASRIFNVFQRLHGKSEYPGSGIGLAICKKIIEYHKGVIYAESTHGIGASFIFIIPKGRKM